MTKKQEEEAKFVGRSFRKRIILNNSPAEDPVWIRAETEIYGEDSAHVGVTVGSADGTVELLDVCLYTYDSSTEQKARAKKIRKTMASLLSTLADLEKAIDKLLSPPKKTTLKKVTPKKESPPEVEYPREVFEKLQSLSE